MPKKKAKKATTAKQRTARRKLDQERQARLEKTKCGANKKDGKPCGLIAGFGTRHEGEGYCRYHGGNTPQHEVALVKNESLNMAKPIDVSPGQALAAVLNLSAGQLAYVTQKVAELKEEDVMGEYGINPWIRFQRSIMGDVAKFAKIAADAGIDERLANLAEEQTLAVARLIEAVAEDLMLSKEQRKILGPAIRQHLQVIEGGNT